jgi:hypothetical protein
MSITHSRWIRALFLVALAVALVAPIQADAGTRRPPRVGSDGAAMGALSTPHDTDDNGDI